MRWTNTIVTSKLSTQEELAIPLSMNTQTHTHTQRMIFQMYAWLCIDQIPKGTKLLDTK